MAYKILNGESLYTVSNVVPFVFEGRYAKVGGSFTTVPGTPSIQLLPSTNITRGYYSGQMLSRAAGGGTGIFANLTPGAFVNFNPASDDAGQAVWSGFILVDTDLVAPLPINVTYSATLKCAVANGGWEIRQQFLYAGGTPATDVAVVQTAVAAFSGIQQFQNANPGTDDGYETVFTY